MANPTTKALLSDKYAKTALPDTRHWDSKHPGFFLQTGKTVKTWYVEARGTRVKLGRWPALSASEARERALVIMSPTSQHELAPV